MASKLTESERKKLDNLQSSLNDKIFSYGRQEYVVNQIQEQLSEEKQAAKEIRSEIADLEDDYDSFVRSLYQKYGDVAIDLDTGDILEQ